MPEMWQGCLHHTFWMMLMHEEKYRGLSMRVMLQRRPPPTPPLSSGIGLGATTELVFAVVPSPAGHLGVVLGSSP